MLICQQSSLPSFTVLCHTHLVCLKCLLPIFIYLIYDALLEKAPCQHIIVYESMVLLPQWAISIARLSCVLPSPSPSPSPGKSPGRSPHGVSDGELTAPKSMFPAQISLLGSSPRHLKCALSKMGSTGYLGGSASGTSDSWFPLRW